MFIALIRDLCMFGRTDDVSVVNYLVSLLLCINKKNANVFKI